MNYEPREGVDYIIDLYAVADAPPHADHDALRGAILRRTAEYHPDRLEGLAEEFRTKGEHMARLLNKARHILLDESRRAEYDDIRNNWEGPVSTDGQPIIYDRFRVQKELATKTPEEAEEYFAALDQKAAEMFGHSPTRLQFLEDIITNSPDMVTDAFRTEYEDALLRKSRFLSLQEAHRSAALGLPDPSEQHYAVGLGYAEQIEARIEPAKTTYIEQLRFQLLGGASTRLALLAGDTKDTGNTTTPNIPALPTLPDYYEDQAAKVVQIAKEREAIARKRLENIILTYPEEHLQTEYHDDIIICIPDLIWYRGKIDHATRLINFASGVTTPLDHEDYQELIQGGANVVLIPYLDHLELSDVITEAVNRHYRKYHSGQNEES